MTKENRNKAQLYWMWKMSRFTSKMSQTITLGTFATNTLLANEVIEQLIVSGDLNPNKSDCILARYLIKKNTEEFNKSGLLKMVTRLRKQHIGQT